MFYLLVVGSRSFNDFDLLNQACSQMCKGYDDVTIVSGGAHGADTLAERFAELHNYKLKVFPAQWNLYGKSAGYRRNEIMHAYISRMEHKACIAFWDGVSKGTQHNFSLAKRYHNDIHVVTF